MVRQDYLQQTQIDCVLHLKILFLTLAIILIIPISQAHASSNPNLYVSAENSKFNNYFSGSMVIEVVIRDSTINETNEGKGEPDVTLNGKALRMVQASDGNWYAYFANVKTAKVADSTVPVGGEGNGLDFGVFCSKNTTALGISLTETEGVAIPRSEGLTGFTNGNISFSSCTGSLTNPGENSINNVVRKARSINTNAPQPGQIGLDPLAWPLVQLFSFNDVSIKYNRAGGVQQVDLHYDEIPNISFNIDRTEYPQNSEVFLTINDIQLNQDPTDEDSWTFNIASPTAVLYQAYDNSGRDSANGNLGLVNLKSYLSSLGFEENGLLSIDLGNVMGLEVNDEQPDSTVSNGAGTSFSKLITLVEEGPNTGVFDNADDNDKSTLKVLSNAPRGQTGKISYNAKSVSVLTGFSTASVSVTSKLSLTIGDGSTSLRPGTEYPVILVDNDQNINSGSRDHLDVFRDSAIIPSMTIGNPITLKNSGSVKFYSISTDDLMTSGKDVFSSVPDKNSNRLIIDSSSLPNGQFEKISLNLGVTSSNLQSTLIDTYKSNTFGTNWINYDLRSLSNDLEVNDFSDASIDLYFGSLGSSPLHILNPGQMSSHGFVKLNDSVVHDIFSKSGPVFVVINLDYSNDSFVVGKISNEAKKQPIVIDFFSFGLVNNQDVNNAIYRFELEETNDNSSVFDGTLEYAITNQLNILDPDFIGKIRPIDDNVKFIVTNKLVDEKGVSLSYSDLAEVGVVITTTAKSDINTHSGTVTLDSPSIRFGQPVTFTLTDPDLNLKSDQIDTYQVIDNPNSPYVDTVGKDNNVLFEVLIKDIRYKRCTINGVEYGGLASTGFSLVETGTNTGIFKGVFKMPSQICDKSGSKLISPAGGSVDAKYYDARDSSGESNIFRLSETRSTTQYSSSPTLNKKEFTLPSKGNKEDVILSGSISNFKSGLPLDLILIRPDGVSQTFSASLTNNGSYKALFTLNDKSLVGSYQILLTHNKINIGSASFHVAYPGIPDWIKNNAKFWSNGEIPDSEFIDGLENLINGGIIRIPAVESSHTSQKEIPEWIKTTANWWANNEISDDDFVLSIEYLIKEGVILI